MLRKILKKMLNLGIVENYKIREMVLYPTAKINIGLYVTEKRADGYHDISSLFYPLNLSDILEFAPQDEGVGWDTLELSGLLIPGNREDNLIIKACKQYRNRYDLPFFKIHLHKLIPLGAGLGGGSSDGSFMLKGLNSYLGNITYSQEIRDLALVLGSDCPFFIDNKCSFAYGRGEILKESSLSLDTYWISIFNPGIHVSTSGVYKQVAIGHPAIPLEESLKLPVEKWRDNVENVFELPVFKMHPQVAVLKDQLYEIGAVFASMSGSGSSVFGIFNNKPEIPEQLLDYHVWTEEL